MKPNADTKPVIPKELERCYQVFFIHSENNKKNISKMREIKATEIGSLISLRGIVMRASDVKP